MDTTGTWPYGRRLEDQVATRFLSLFLDHTAEVGGKPITVESLNDPATYAAAPVTPKVPPNPLHNDVEFSTEFPYLAPPWPAHALNLDAPDRRRPGLARLDRLLADPPTLTERQQIVRTVVLHVERANLFGRDDDVDTALR